MGFFSKRPAEPEGLSRQYLRSAPPGPRTDNLAISCLQRIGESNLTAEARFGELLTVEALGPASRLVRETMTQDRALSGWIARKGAVIFHSVLSGGMEGSVGEKLDQAYASVGLAVNGAVTVRGAASSMPQHEADAATGLGAVSLSMLRVVSSPPHERRADDRDLYVKLHTAKGDADIESLAYDILGWYAVVIGRLHRTGRLRPDLPIHRRAFREVPRLTREGWYPNPPKFGDVSSGDAQFQRYWDGSSWTDRVRVQQARGWTEGRVSLHDPPTD
jgi:hypothetical protein